MRPFRYINVNCFNILRFFVEVSSKLQRMHFFRQFKDHNSGTEHGNYTNDPVFFIYFFCSTCLSRSVLNLKILKIHFHRDHIFHFSFGPFWSLKYLIFSKLLIRAAHHSFLESRHAEATKNLYYVFFHPPEPNAPFLGSSSRTILEVEENFMQSLSAFLLLFWWQKIAFKSLFDLYFHPFIIELF